MRLHFIVHFEPAEGCGTALRDALHVLQRHSRTEAGCRRFLVLESVKEPRTFAIHSEWDEDAAFDRHASLPHTVTFMATVADLLARPLGGIRLRAWP